MRDENDVSGPRGTEDECSSVTCNINTFFRFFFHNSKMTIPASSVSFPTDLGSLHRLQDT